MAFLQLGSKAHKELFCHSFLDSYQDYEPANLPWPDLNAADLEKLRGIPFWQEALSTERNAGVMVSAWAEQIDDPLIKTAIALQGEEEYRHARLLEFLVNYYDIPVEIPDTDPLPTAMETAFIDFGFTECLDSFFAFGMFGIARQAHYLPEAMFSIFDPLLDEEARHIVFFVNWLTYCELQKSHPQYLRGMKTIWHYGRALRELVRAFGGATDNGEGFTATDASHFMDDLTAELFFKTCLEENAKRMGKFDDRLLQPLLLPRLSQLALSTLTLLPQKKTTPLPA
ncbi:MAG: hypothetical protein ACK58N_19545 [Synechocystis sp.]|jgi:hypothetical protein